MSSPEPARHSSFRQVRVPSVPNKSLPSKMLFFSFKILVDTQRTGSRLRCLTNGSFIQAAASQRNTIGPVQPVPFHSRFSVQQSCGPNVKANTNGSWVPLMRPHPSALLFAVIAEGVAIRCKFVWDFARANPPNSRGPQWLLRLQSRS